VGRVRPWAQTLSALGLLTQLAACGMSHPAFSWPYHNIGPIYMSQKNSEQALAWLTKALDPARNYLDAQLGRDARPGPTPLSVR